MGAPKPLTISINPKPPRGRRGGDPPENPPKNKTSPPGCKSNPVKSLREQPSPAPKVGSSRETRLLSQPGLKAFLGAPKPLTISINPKPPRGRRSRNPAALSTWGDPPENPPKNKTSPPGCKSNPVKSLREQPSPAPKVGSSRETRLLSQPGLKAFLGAPKPLTISINPKPPRGRRGGDPENPPKNKTSPPGCKSNPVKSLREQPSPAPKVGSSRETRLLSQPGLKAFLGAPKPLTISINPKPPRGRRGGDPPENPPKNKTSPPGCKSNPVKSLREQPSPAPKVGSSRETRLLSQPGLKAFLGAPKPLTISINPKPPRGRRGETPPRTPPKTKQALQVARATLSKACESSPAQPQK